jgi:hypothetical protein
MARASWRATCRAAFNASQVTVASFELSRNHTVIGSSWRSTALARATTWFDASRRKRVSATVCRRRLSSASWAHRSIDPPVLRVERTLREAGVTSAHELYGGLNYSLAAPRHLLALASDMGG